MREELIGEVELAGLAGRGGAGFPTARKLAAVAARRNAVVVGNGTEGEPASAKDKVLMAQSPHLVLDGAAAAAGLVGATEAIVVVHAAVADVMTSAVAERRRARADRVRLSVVPAAGAFVAGEASAVVHWLESSVPKPKSTRRRLSERGLHGRPTLVQNVETLAHLALIVRYGAAWFRAVGTQREPGSMLVTLAGAVRVPGVYEVGIGTPVGAVLDLAGGQAGLLGGLLIGGYFGSWVDPERAASLPLSGDGLGQLGAGPAPACWPRCPPMYAAWRRPPGSRGTWPASRPVSAGRASSAWTPSPASSSAWRLGAAPTWSRCAGGSPRWGTDAGRASILTAPSPWSRARCERSAARSSGTPPAGAAAFPAGRARCPRRAGLPHDTEVGMKLSVDMIACEGRGLCAEVLPELIRLDDWGYPMIVSQVPPDLDEHAREAVRLCPRLALRLSR